MTENDFQRKIWSWHRTHGRYDLPWRKTPKGRAPGFSRAPYRILVSEVMLQRTQVSQVIPRSVQR